VRRCESYRGGYAGSRHSDPVGPYPADVHDET
jgi:hypothetical protein